jgi:hypothetical protein
MGTNIRASISESNPFYISKHEYLMTKHFAMQYVVWKKQKTEIETRIAYGFKIGGVRNEENVSPVEILNEYAEKYSSRIELIERIAKIAGEDIWQIVLVGVTTDCNYEYLRLVKNIPCCKDTYYKMYRKFFWLLNRELLALIDTPPYLQPT